MDSKEGVAERITEVLSVRPEILEAYLFGSLVRGTDQAHSDVDVAVYVNEEKIEPGLFGYRAELTSALMSSLGTNSVDVVVLNRAPSLLYHRVLPRAATPAPTPPPPAFATRPDCPPCFHGRAR